MSKPHQKVLALVGNPNCGKTTLFNGLTGGNHRIGNWPGVTVEKKEGALKMKEPGTFLANPFIGQGAILDQGHTVRPNEQPLSRKGAEQITLVDLPGIYNLSAVTEDERVARDYLLSGQADYIINIIDAANLERNLYLTLQLRELGTPMVIVLTMMDIAKEKNISLQPETLSQHLGVPVFTAQGTSTKEIQALAGSLHSLQGFPYQPLTIPYGETLEARISEFAPTPVVQQILNNLDSPYLQASRIHGEQLSRWITIQLLENPSLFLENPELTFSSQERSTFQNDLKIVSSKLGDDPDILLAEAKYTFIEQICSQVLVRGITRQSVSDQIDRIVMHRYLDIPLFFLVMYGVFWFTMYIGGGFIDFFDILAGAIFVDGAQALLTSFGSPDWLVGILAQGIGTGIQTISTFIPIIFSMFFALTFLEDSGYMARAAFVMDRFMQYLGLPGKAFIPMIVGFGCTVPGIMGTRTLESTKDRFTTIFMTPFMSCGARLPVYALFIVALFPQQSGLVVFSIYLVGIVFAVLTGLLLKFTVFRGASSHFVLELPPYHRPRIIYSMQDAGKRAWSFVVRAGVVIVVAVGLLSILNSVSIQEGSVSFGDPDRPDSVLSQIGRTVTPVFGPMGIESDNWPATVGLFTGVFAKEVVVGTLQSLYVQDGLRAEGTVIVDSDEPEEDEGFSFWALVQEAFQSIAENFVGLAEGFTDPLGLGVLEEEDEDLSSTASILATYFSPAAGYAYLLFILIYTPCLAAVGAAIREMGRNWGLGLSFYLLGLAWSVGVIFYQIAEGGSIGWVLVALGLIGAMAGIFGLLGAKTRRLGPMKPVVR